MIKNSVLFTEGDVWKNKRKCISGAFTFENLKNFTPKMQKIIQKNFDDFNTSDGFRVMRVNQIGKELSSELSA